MGRIIETLVHREIDTQSVFPNRFVIECVENFHIHYKNLRIALAKEDFIEVCKGCIQAFERWTRRGCPINTGEHIELCRKQIGKNCLNEGIRINLNKNLYNDYAGKIFSSGNGITDETYIHLKLRDTRIELSIAEFKELANAVKEADERLKSRDTCTCIQAS